MTRAQVLATAQASNAVIYTIALVDPLDTEADPGFLAELASMTGRRWRFGPVAAGDVEGMLQRIARRHPQHVHASAMCRPTATVAEPECPTARKDELRRVSVEVRLPSGQKLEVRTRRAYLAGEEEVQSDAR